MEIVRHPLSCPETNRARVEIVVDRHTLAKRRWRGLASDGREFGFDLEEPLSDGVAVFDDGQHVYVVRQQPESLFEVALGDDPVRAAEMGWSIGNMHLPMEVKGSAIRMAAEPAARTLLANRHIAFREITDVFRPLRAAAAHHHHHH
jgi:urease accessory protein